MKLYQFAVKFDNGVVSLWTHPMVFAESKIEAEQYVRSKFGNDLRKIEEHAVITPESGVFVYLD